MSHKKSILAHAALSLSRKRLRNEAFEARDVRRDDHLAFFTFGRARARGFVASSLGGLAAVAALLHLPLAERLDRTAPTLHFLGLTESIRAGRVRLSGGRKVRLRFATRWSRKSCSTEFAARSDDGLTRCGVQDFDRATKCWIGTSGLLLKRPVCHSNRSEAHALDDESAGCPQASAANCATSVSCSSV